MNLVTEYDLGLVKNKIRNLEHRVEELAKSVEASTQVLDAIRSLLESRGEQ